jgi:H/ACA ribonucleoprotein complex subunit 4
MSNLPDSFFVVIDKPTNLIAHDVTSRVGRLFGLKSGHAGTLDPYVSGVMPIGLGRATKLLRFLAGDRKKYVCLAKFPKRVSEEEVREVLKGFEGKIVQIPPKESAVAKRPRIRTVFSVRLLEVFGNRVLFEAEVEAGTYMRVICKDMGAEMEDLRRTAVGKITEEKAITMHELWYSVVEGKPKIITVEEMFDSVLPSVWISPEGAIRITQGQPFYPDYIERMETFEKGENVAVFCQDRFVGVARAMLSSKTLKKAAFAALKTERIHLMPQKAKKLC